MISPFLFAALDPASAGWIRALEKSLRADPRENTVFSWVDCAAMDERALASSIGGAMDAIRERIARVALDPDLRVSDAIQVILCLHDSHLPAARMGVLEHAVPAIARMPAPPVGAHGLSFLILHGAQSAARIEAAAQPGQAAARLYEFLQTLERDPAYQRNGWMLRWFWIAADRVNPAVKDSASAPDATCGTSGASEPADAADQSDRSDRSDASDASEASDGLESAPGSDAPDPDSSAPYVPDPYIEAMRRLVQDADLQGRNSVQEIVQHGLMRDGSPLPPLFSTFFSRCVCFPRDSFVQWLRLRLAAEMIQLGPLRPLSGISEWEAGEMRAFLGRRMEAINTLGIAAWIKASGSEIRAALPPAFSELEVPEETLAQWRKESLEAAHRAETKVGESAVGPQTLWRQFLDHLSEAILPNPAAPLEWLEFLMERAKSERAAGARVVKDARECEHPCLDRLYEENIQDVFFHLGPRSWLIYLSKAADMMLSGKPSNLMDDIEFQDALLRAKTLLGKLPGASAAGGSAGSSSWERAPQALLAGILGQVLELCGNARQVPGAQQMEEFCKNLKEYWEKIVAVRNGQEHACKIWKQDYERRRENLGEIKSRIRWLRGLWRCIFCHRDWQQDCEEVAAGEPALEASWKAHEEQKRDFNRALRCAIQAQQEMLPSVAAWSSLLAAWDQLEKERQSRIGIVRTFRGALEKLRDKLDKERDSLDFPADAFLTSIPRKEMMPAAYKRLMSEDFEPPHNLVLDALIKLRQDRQPLCGFFPDNADAYRNSLEAVGAQYFDHFARMSAVEFMGWYYHPRGESMSRLQQLIWPAEVISAPMQEVLFGGSDARVLTFFGIHEADAPQWTALTQATWPGTLHPPLILPTADSPTSSSSLTAAASLASAEAAARLRIAICVYYHHLKESETALFHLGD